MKGAHPDEPVSTEARRARFATPNGLGTPGPSAGDTEVEVTEAAGRRRRVLVDIAVWHQKDARLVWCACPDSSSHSASTTRESVFEIGKVHLTASTLMSIS